MDRKMKALRFVGLLVMAGLITFVVNAADDRPIAIVHVRLIDGMGGTPVENATVLLRDKTIEYAGPATGVSVPKNAQIMDATGKTVMPGLADMHVHLQGAWDGTSVDLFAALA